MLRAVRAAQGLLLFLALLGSIASADQGPREASAPDHRPIAANAPSTEALACEADLSRRTPGKGSAPRVGTWNVRWFPRGTAKGKDLARRTDVRWLACAIAALDVDVIALQEILDDADARNAQLDLIERLETLTGDRYRMEIDDCSSGAQHVAFLWNERRVRLSKIQPLAALNPHGRACASSLRPGLYAHARFANGETAHLVALHLDAGVNARDHANRATSIDALARELSLLPGQAMRAIVLGDYNSMGCAKCEPPIGADEELHALDTRLGAQSLTRVRAAPEQACSHYYKKRPSTLDHIAVGRGLAPRARLETHGACERLACRYPARGMRVPEWQTLSDHCPRVLELTSRKRTRGQASGR